MRSTHATESRRRAGFGLLLVTGSAAVLLVGAGAPELVAARSGRHRTATPEPTPAASAIASPAPCLPAGSPTPEASTSTTPSPSPDAIASPDAAAAPCASPEASVGPSASPSPAAVAQVVLTGQPVDTQFGTTQVQVTIQGSRILDVQPLQMPYDRARSAQISQIVAPMLHDEVMQAQSGQIDVVSGATYTSEAYAMSLQSALDQRPS